MFFLAVGMSLVCDGRRAQTERRPNRTETRPSGGGNGANALKWTRKAWRCTDLPLDPTIIRPMNSWRLPLPMQCNF